MRTFSTIAIFALALTGANAATYDDVTKDGVVQVGDPDACPVRLPARSSLFCVGRFARGHDARARARGARGIGSRRERARASARASATNPPRYTRSSALARRGR